MISVEQYKIKKNPIIVKYLHKSVHMDNYIRIDHLYTTDCMVTHIRSSSEKSAKQDSCHLYTAGYTT